MVLKKGNLSGRGIFHLLKPPSASAYLAEGWVDMEWRCNLVCHRHVPFTRFAIFQWGFSRTLFAKGLLELRDLSHHSLKMTWNCQVRRDTSPYRPSLKKTVDETFQWNQTEFRGEFSFKKINCPAPGSVDNLSAAIQWIELIILIKNWIQFDMIFPWSGKRLLILNNIQTSSICPCPPGHWKQCQLVVAATGRGFLQDAAAGLLSSAMQSKVNKATNLIANVLFIWGG